MKVKITIPQVGHHTTIEVDGVDISRNVQGIRAFAHAGEMPVLQLDLVPEEVAIEFDRDFSPQELQVMEPLWDRLKQARHSIPDEDAIQHAAQILQVPYAELIEFSQKIRKANHGNRPSLAEQKQRQGNREEELERLNRMFDANEN